MRASIVWQSPSAVTLVSKTTTYHNDTPGALPSQPWQLLLSANHWLVEFDVFLMAFSAAVKCEMSAIVWIQLNAWIHNIPVMYRRWRHQLFHSCSFQWGRRQRHDNVVDSLNVFADKTITPYEGGFKQVTWGHYVHYICRTAIRTVGLIKKKKYIHIDLVSWTSL